MHSGSIGVCVEVGHLQAPVGNEYGQEPHPAHDAIGILPIAREMAFNYLSEGKIIDTCNGYCDFSPNDLVEN